jgi:hypothetical protein
MSLELSDTNQGSGVGKAIQENPHFVLTNEEDTNKANKIHF